MTMFEDYDELLTYFYEFGRFSKHYEGFTVFEACFMYFWSVLKHFEIFYTNSLKHCVDILTILELY